MVKDSRFQRGLLRLPTVSVVTALFVTVELFILNGCALKGNTLGRFVLREPAVGVGTCRSWGN